jgi:hypothetical protein
VLGRRRSKWEDNVNMDCTALREEGPAMDSSDLGEGQVIVSYERCNKLSLSIKCSEFINQMGKKFVIPEYLLSWIYLLVIFRTSK